MPNKETQKALEKAQLKDMKIQLANIQQPLRDSGIPVIILLEGFSAAGKGDMIGELISRLDPRGYDVYPLAPMTAEDKRLPFLAPFWKQIPQKGEIAIFSGSWYSRLKELPEKARSLALEEIAIFERQLADDGYLIIKLFLTIDKNEQYARLCDFADDESTAWRVTHKDWLQNRKYKQFQKGFNAIMAHTNYSHATWHTVDNNKVRSGTIDCLSFVLKSIADAMVHGIASQHEPYGEVETLPTTPLGNVPLGYALEEEEYRKELKKEKAKLRELHQMLYHKKVPVILAFEGWDAAGKGGAIRRLSWALDPRGFDVVPIASPSKDELNHHYLWRFMNHLPKDGHIAIFDRTWYGRVMVERLEGFTPEKRWSMAYQEINEFETSLTNWGAIVLKFWIHIDKDEQLARFTDRQNTPEKQYKLTDEDWRNREKWDVYEEAVDEMIAKTNTQNAPWIVVEGNNKAYARLKVLKTVRRALEERLKD